MSSSEESLVLFKRIDAIDIGDATVLCDDFLSLCLDSKWSDAVFVVEGQRLPVHRVILGARSKYFAALLAQSPAGEDIPLDVPLNTFKIILQYLYSSVINPSKITLVEALSALSVSHEYDMRAFTSAIGKYLQKNTYLENVCDILNSATFYDLEELTLSCVNYIVAQQDRFVKIQASDNLSPKSLKSVLQRQFTYLNAFYILRGWHKSHPTKNIKPFRDYVNLDKATPTDLAHIIQPSGLYEDAEILEYLKKATWY